MLLDSMDTVLHINFASLCKKNNISLDIQLSSPSTATEKLELTRPVSRRTPKQNTSVKTKTKLGELEIKKNIIYYTS